MVRVVYPREREVLEFVAQYIQRHGYAPTLVEICDALGLSAPSTVHEHLDRLEKKGYIKKTKGFERSIEVVEGKAKFKTEETAIELPVLGFIAAGHPLEPHTDPNLYLPIPASLINNKKTGYVLQVKGESMIEDGIFDGDYAVIQHQENAQSGDLVVAILPNGLATLKKIYFEKNRIRLEPANSSMSPIYTTHVKIQGKVIAVIRKFAKF